jgi:predicted acyltransferase
MLIMSPPTEEPARSPAGRLVSLDAFRGFDMFWIIGGDLVVRSLPKIHRSTLTEGLAAQMEHCDWAGFHFYDLIFPMFVFIVGASIVFSISGMVEKVGRAATVKRIVFRSVILFLLGIFYMGGVADGFKNMYFVGVLQRIAVAYFFTALIFCFLSASSSSSASPVAPKRPCGGGSSSARPVRPGINRRGLIAMIAITIVLLIGYWALMTFVPVPGVGKPTLEVPGKNLAHYLDDLYMPGKKFEGTILSTMAAVANCLLGVFAGLLLKSQNVSSQSKAYWLFGAGVTSLALGFLWAQTFPIIKLLWTSSYVLVACGYSAILLAIFYQVVDILGFQKWARPFIWVGMNPITIYIAGTIINWRRLSLRFVGGDIATLLGTYSDFVAALVGLSLAIGLAYYLYWRQIFLRL